MKANNRIKRSLTVLSLVFVVMATMAFAYHVTPQEAKVISVAEGAVSLSPNDLSSALNVTLSHLSYTTQPPQFLVNSTDYGTNATYTDASTAGTWATNATYQIFQHNATTTSSTAAALSYYMKGKTTKATEYFADMKFGLNGTATSPMVEFVLGASAASSAVSTTALTQSASNVTAAETIFVMLNATASGTSYTYNATLVYWYQSSGSGYNVNYTPFSVGPSASVGAQPLQALNMYELQFNLQPKEQQVSIVYTNNGTIAQATPIIKMTNATKNPFLNFSTMDNLSMVFTPTTGDSGALLFDWAYVVDKNTISYAGGENMAAGAVAGSSAYLEPSFDPTSVANQSRYQAANTTNTYSGISISNDIFNSVVNQTDPSIQNATGLNDTNVISSLAVQFDAPQAIATNAFVNVTNNTVSTNMKVSSWNTTYITTVLTNYLKAYAADQAAKNLKTYVSVNDITLISYRIGSIFMDSNFTQSAASQIATYLDNSYASLLAKENLSIVNPNTAAIVGGAGAGDFYWNGMAVHPEIQNGMIVNPITNQKFTLESAGFSPGAYITGGSVIIPQLTFMGFVSGSPVFAASSTFDTGSIFSTLSSAGTAVSNLFKSGASTITNGIGTVSKVIDNNVIEPLATAATGSVSTFKSDLSQLSNSAMGTFGIVGQDVQGAFSKGITGLTSSVNSIKTSLSSVGSEASSAIMSGYKGVKTGIYSIGAGVDKLAGNVSNGLNGVKNTLINTVGKASSTATAALSTIYTKMSNYVSGAAGSVYTDIRGITNTTLNSLDSVGNTLVGYANASGNFVKNAFTVSENALGIIGNDISNGFHKAFSAIGGVLPAIGHVLLYIGIGVLIVVVGFVIFAIWRAKSTTDALKGIGERQL